MRSKARGSHFLSLHSARIMCKHEGTGLSLLLMSRPEPLFSCSLEQLRGPQNSHAAADDLAVRHLRRLPDRVVRAALDVVDRLGDRVQTELSTLPALSLPLATE